MNVGGDTRLVDMTIGELLDILEDREIRLKAEIIEAIGPKQREEEEPFITADEVSVMLGVALNTVANRTRNGEIPSYKVGGKRLYRKSEILQMISGGRCTSKADIEAMANAYVARNRMPR